MQKQVATLDYAPAFQYGHPASFALANKIKELTPAGLDYVFFTGSGSESADTSLKMARAYWRAKGQGTIRLDVQHRYPLAAAAQAHRDLESRTTIGPLILVP